MRILSLLGTIAAGWLIGYNSNSGNSGTGDPHSVNFIHKDTANRMIQSYITSVDAIDAEEQLYSVMLDADDIRTYLSDTAIHGVKIMFAHTLKYINAGNEGVAAGLESGALTIVMAGYNRGGNYVFAPGMRVLNNVRPCPPKCPLTGTASQHTLQ